MDEPKSDDEGCMGVCFRTSIHLLFLTLFVMGCNVQTELKELEESSGIENCGVTPHLGTATRTMYLKSFVLVGSGESCLSETQGRVCTAGIWSAWTGTYEETSCEVRDLNYLFFSATPSDFELWVTDGSLENTGAASDFWSTAPPMPGSQYNSMVKFKGKQYLSGQDASYGNELYSFDSETFERVTDINPGSGSSYINEITVFGDVLCFRAHEPAYGFELYCYDGTTTTRISDIWTLTGSGYPDELIVYNNKLYFRATQPTYGSELYSYDGTTVTRVTDINPGSGDAYPSHITVYNNKLYFAATDSAAEPPYGTELYSYDGTTVTRITDINPGSASAYPSSLAVYNNKLFFNATDSAAEPAYGTELYSYDGTTVTRLTDINPGTGNSNIYELTVYKNKLFFRASDGATSGDELFAYDDFATEPAPELIKDIRSGPNGSYPSYFYFVNNLMFFSAYDDSHGYELWVTDGTTEGTQLFYDIYPGANGSWVFSD